MVFMIQIIFAIYVTKPALLVIIVEIIAAWPVMLIRIDKWMV